MELTEALAFDMDDTLYLERDFVRSGFRAVGACVLDTYGLADFDETCWKLFTCGIRGDTFSRAAALRAITLSDKQLMDLVSIYRDHEPDIELDMQVRLTLSRLAGEHRLVLLTGGPPSGQRKKIQALGLEKYFEYIRLTGLDGPEKDKPRVSHWIEAERVLGLSGQAITCIGDNPVKDVTPSLARGWQAIRVRLRQSLHEAVDTPTGATEIQSVSSLISIN